MEDIEFWIHFLLKIQKKNEKSGFEGKWIECVHTWGQQHLSHYRYMKEDNLFCFVIMIFSKPQGFKLCYGIIFRKFSISAPTWFRMFVVMMWNLLIIEPFFHWFLKKNQDWKLYSTLGALLVLFKSPHQVWFNSDNFIILKPKIWTILLNF